MLHYDIVRYVISVVIACMLAFIFCLAILGIMYYFADRKVSGYYKNWRGKKQWKTVMDDRTKSIFTDPTCGYQPFPTKRKPSTPPRKP